VTALPRLLSSPPGFQKGLRANCLACSSPKLQCSSDDECHREASPHQRVQHLFAWHGRSRDSHAERRQDPQTVPEESAPPDPRKHQALVGITQSNADFIGKPISARPDFNFAALID
jgi:hypothetical protein